MFETLPIRMPESAKILIWLQNERRSERGGTVGRCTTEPHGGDRRPTSTPHRSGITMKKKKMKKKRKKLWKTIWERRDCREKRCTTEPHGGDYRPTSTPHRSEITMKKKKSDNFFPLGHKAPWPLAHLDLLGLCAQHLRGRRALLEELAERVLLEAHVSDGASRLARLLARVDEHQHLKQGGDRLDDR